MQRGRRLTWCLAFLLPCVVIFVLVVSIKEMDMIVAYTPTPAARLLGLNTNGGRLPWSRFNVTMDDETRLSDLLERFLASFSRVETLLMSAESQRTPAPDDQNAALLLRITSSLDRLEKLMAPNTAPGQSNGDTTSALQAAVSSLERLQTSFQISVDQKPTYPLPLPSHQYRQRWGLERNISAESTVQWRPHAGKYLLATCLFGRMSNKRKCLQGYFAAAALLNRTLVIPNWSERIGETFYHFELVVNASFVRECLGGNAAVSEAEYRAEIGVGPNDLLVVDRYMCVRVKEREPAYCPEAAKVQGLFERSSLKVPPKESVGQPGALDMRLVAEQLRDERLITLGDLFAAGFTSLGGDPLPATPYGPFNTTCKMLMRPHSAIIEAARGFIESFIGEEYMAVHLRRGDFYGRGLNYYYSLLEVARCLREGLPPSSSISTIFLATDASEMEVEILTRHLASHETSGRALAVVRFPKLDGHSYDWRWSAGWNRLNLDMDAELAVPLAEKLVSALATVFRGTPHSTFTEDIWTMRYALQRDTHLDADVCFGRSHREVPLIGK